MSQVRTKSSELPQPLRFLGAGLRRLPGAGQVSKVADGALDRIGAVSPRGRRIAVYTGAGVLGVAGVVEWPVALAGAAVAWLTQPSPQRGAQAEQDGPGRDRPRPGAAESPSTSLRSPDVPAEDQGPGDRLAPSHFQPDHAENGRHDQPAKVGDPATTSGLKQVAEATAHHDTHPGAHRDGP
ncbi:hypothetical protein ACHBTE_14815 [Streptomyces sp. M41]|uniref:hypothetical protein n=1 Tax=Streptomyces sp. M41 TaxID=3059412 RepID=UPI00374C90D7